MVNGPDITPNAAGVYVGNNAVSSQTSYRHPPTQGPGGFDQYGNYLPFGPWIDGIEGNANPAYFYPPPVEHGENGVMEGSLWFVSDDRVTRIDAITGAFQSEILLPPGYVGIDIMPSGSYWTGGWNDWTYLDSNVMWCYCRRIFLDDICKIVINCLDNSFTAILSVTSHFPIPTHQNGTVDGNIQRLPARGQGYQPSWFGNDSNQSAPYWVEMACDPERRLVWSLGTRRYAYNTNVDGVLVRTNVSKPLNDGWGYNFFSDWIPPEWNSQKQKQGCSMFPIGGSPTGMALLDDGSVFVSQIGGGYESSWFDIPIGERDSGLGMVVKYSPWIDQEVTETYRTSQYGATYEGPVEEARAYLDASPNLLISDGSNVWGSTQTANGSSSSYPIGSSIFRISGTSGELTHETLFPMENVYDITEGGVYLYVLVGGSYYEGGSTGSSEGSFGPNRIVKLYKANLNIVGETDFPGAVRIISYDSEILWVKTSTGTAPSTADRMVKVFKSILFEVPYWLHQGYSLGYTDVDGQLYGSREVYQHGRLSRGTPGSWGGHLIFIDIGYAYGSSAFYSHVLGFDPTTGYAEVLTIGANSAYMPEYGRGNQGGGAGFYHPQWSNEYNYSGEVFARTRFPRPLPPNSHIAIHDQHHSDVSQMYWYFYEGQNLECSVLYEGDDYITRYTGTTVERYYGGYVSSGTNFTRIGMRYTTYGPYATYFMNSFPISTLGVREIRSIGGDILLYHDHKNVPQSPTSWEGPGSEFDPSMKYGNITIRNGANGAWFTMDADIVCSDNTPRRGTILSSSGWYTDRYLGMMLFDIGSQNLYSQIRMESFISDYVALGEPTHLPDIPLLIGNQFVPGFGANNPFLMQVGPPPAREGQIGNNPFGEYGSALYILSADWGLKAYGLVGGGYGGEYVPTVVLDVSISNDPNRAPWVGSATPKEMIPTSDGFFILDTNNVVRRINVTPSPPNIYVYERNKTRASVFGNDDLVNVRFWPVSSNEKLSHIYWEFGDGTSAEDSGNGLYAAGQTGGVTTWPVIGEVNHIYAPGVYQVKVTGVYGRSNSYNAQGYLGYRPYLFPGAVGAPFWMNRPFGEPNGTYLGGAIDATSMSRTVSAEITIEIASKQYATIGIQPLTGEQMRPYMNGSILDLYPDMSYMDNGTLVLNMIPTWYSEDIEWTLMVLRFFHISSFYEPYGIASSGRLEIFTQFDGAAEQPLDIKNWAGGDSPIIFQRSFNSNWAADQQFIGNEFDIVARWRSSIDSSIVSPTARQRVRISGIGVPNWSLDHIEIAPDLQ